MGLDPLSAIAPARLKALLIPAGPITRSKFLSFAERLRQEHVVRLGDVSPDGRPHRTMFSPLAFPTGSVIFDISTSLPPPSHLALAPFELYREPLIVLGIADYTSIRAQLDHEDEPAVTDANVDKHREYSRALADVLSPVLEELQVGFPRALIHELLIFNYDDQISKPFSGMMAIPPPELSKTTTIKTIMCDLTSHLLAEMTTYAKSLQALPMVESPKQTLSSLHLNGGTEPNYQLNLAGYQKGRTLSRTSKAALVAADPRFGISTSKNRLAFSSDGTRTPPTTFDEITVGSANPSVPYSSVQDTKRSTSQDKVSVHGFGAGSFGERERNKGKGRIGIIIGSLYLLAGRWPDAVRELTDNALIARTHNDHIWHAKALDYLLVCLLMYAWAGLDFRIPQILFPGTEKQNSKSQDQNSFDSTSEIASSGSPGALGLVLSIQQLSNVIPEIVQHILNLYVRAWTFTEDKLPQLSFSDSIIRFAKLFTVINSRNGNLDEIGLQRIVLNNDVPRLSSSSFKPRSFLSRTEIAGLLIRAFPIVSSTDPISVDDRIMILSGMASVLSDLGFSHKRGFILKEILTVLLPALVQARKHGAAEMGLHPAASILSNNVLSTISDVHTGHAWEQDFETGIRGFLALVCHAYDIRPCEFSNIHLVKTSLPSPESNISSLDKPESIIARVVQKASMRPLGDYLLKLEVLGLCTSICETLPDLQGVISYSAETLSTAGSGIVPGPDNNGGSPGLLVEEQVRLANNISRAIGASRQLGVQKIEAEYWDEFLVRDIQIIRASPLAIPMPHARSDLGAAKIIAMEEEKSPFIHNPFRKSASSPPDERFVVAEEETSFQITLQNLYEFDLEIETIKLATTGLEFKFAQTSTLVGPYRFQSIILRGTAMESGALTISGCRVKVRGCRERYFPLFNAPWRPQAEVKIGRPRNLDLDKVIRSQADVSSFVKDCKHHDLSHSSLTLNVIKAQPSLVVKSVSLPQSAVMLLQGERKSINVILQNVSSVSVNLLFLSFEDSITNQLRSALANRSLSPSEIYEIEHTLIDMQTFRWKRKAGNVDTQVNPGMETSIEIELLGKPGLSQGKILVDYGHLEDFETETADAFYTRQLTIPLTITVNASIELVRNNLLPFQTDFAWQNRQLQQGAGANSESFPPIRRKVSLPLPSYESHNHFQSLLGRIGLNPQDSDHCLLYLDLRNSWPNLLSISIDIRSTGFSEHWKRAYTVHEPLQPGHTSRVLLILPRIYLPNPIAPIPSLSSAKKRQYVVSSGPQFNAETENAGREAFHYREALLGHIRATWEEKSTQRAGVINLRALNLTTRMVSAFKKDDLEITISIGDLPSSTSPSSQAEFKQLSPSRFQVPTRTFFHLTTTITNRSPSPIHPLLRIQPALKNQPHAIALDLGKKFVWSGLLQRGLDVLAPGENIVSELGVVVLCSGIFEVGATVEEIRVLGDHSRGTRGVRGQGGNDGIENHEAKIAMEGGGAGGGGDQQDHTSTTTSHPAHPAHPIITLPNAEPRDRKIWHAREKLTLLAIEHADE